MKVCCNHLWTIIIFSLKSNTPGNGLQISQYRGHVFGNPMEAQNGMQVCQSLRHSTFNSGYSQKYGSPLWTVFTINKTQLLVSNICTMLQVHLKTFKNYYSVCWVFSKCVMSRLFGILSLKYFFHKTSIIINVILIKN